MNVPDLSARGRQLIADSPVPEYIERHMEGAATADHDDPDRYVGLCVAQNLLMWDLLDAHVNRDRHVEPASVAYDDPTGSEALRSQIAAFASEHVWGRPVAADHVTAHAGAGAALEILFYAIADAGQGVLIPTPSYSFYWPDIETRDGLVGVPVHTESTNGFRLTPELLDKAKRESDVEIAALLLTNPDNPTGRIMRSEDIEMAIAWARSHGLHIVVNGVYALSVHGDRPYVPVSEIIEDVGTDIHEVWGFSKDFAMSGLRAGVLTSSNEDVLAAIRTLSYWSTVSGDTQHLIVNMLRDRSWVEAYLPEMTKRLRESYVATTEALDAAGIPHIPSDAGLFLLADLRPFMDEVSWEAEDRLWRRIVDEARVNLTPGSACHIGEPGFMRVCFATEPPDVVHRAIERIARVIA